MLTIGLAQFLLSEDVLQVVGAIVLLLVHLEVPRHGHGREVVHLLSGRGVRLRLRPLQVGLQVVDRVLQVLDGSDKVGDDAVGRAHVLVEGSALESVIVGCEIFRYIDGLQVA